MNDKDFGEIKITIGEFLKKKGISKNKLMNKAEMQRTQLNNYCNQKIQRLDMSIISKICYVLECDIGDILKYCPPNKDNENKPNER
ncbi:MAG: helix-turn-helix transcriptional regulator [Clostridia bacterium]|nr:helix-turn-helix transcriptional regulator [Clostridia bacterium]